jgi:hypothetical protein
MMGRKLNFKIDFGVKVGEKVELSYLCLIQPMRGTKATVREIGDTYVFVESDEPISPGRYQLLKRDYVYSITKEGLFRLRKGEFRKCNEELA